MRRQFAASMQCRLCRVEPADAGAHVIAKGFYRMIDPDFDQEIRVFSTDSEARTPRRRTGAIDHSILCRSCEQRFQSYDDHAIKALSDEPVPSSLWGTHHARELQGFDARKLKLAFMHTTWRAHESSLVDFAAVNIGSRADRLRDLLLKDDPGADRDFQAVLLLHPADPDGHYAISPPFPHGKWENGARYLHMMIARWVILITTSSLGLPANYEPYVLTPNRPIPVGMLPKGWRDAWTGQEAMRALAARERTQGPGQ